MKGHFSKVKRGTYCKGKWKLVKGKGARVKIKGALIRGEKGKGHFAYGKRGTSYKVTRELSYIKRSIWKRGHCTPPPTLSPYLHLSLSLSHTHTHYLTSLFISLTIKLFFLIWFPFSFTLSLSLARSLFSHCSISRLFPCIIQWTQQYAHLKSKYMKGILYITYQKLCSIYLFFLKQKRL